MKRIRSDRVAHLVQSEIRAMTRACNEFGGVNMGQGICDVPTPELVKEAGIRAIEENRSVYSRYDGTEELREALSWRLHAHNGLTYDANTEVLATIGASGAFAATVMALCNPGDEIILFEPFYGYHLNTALVAGLKPVFHPLNPPDFEIELDALASRITPKTRAIVINTPVNPSGKVFTRAELSALATLIIEHDLLCITDEVYEYLVFDGAEHVSMATIPGMRERTVTIGSYSKTFSITGWRVGFAASAAPLAEAVGLVNDLYYVCSPTPLQHAVAVGIRQSDDAYYSDMCASYQKKRDQFCGVLAEIGLEPIVPRGAYYVLADVSSLAVPTAKEAAMTILKDGGVASVPGSAFFRNGGEHLTRFCFAKQQSDLDEACDRLLKWHATR